MLCYSLVFSSLPTLPFSDDSVYCPRSFMSIIPPLCRHLAAEHMSCYELLVAVTVNAQEYVFHHRYIVVSYSSCKPSAIIAVPRYQHNVTSAPDVCFVSRRHDNSDTATRKKCTFFLYTPWFIKSGPLCIFAITFSNVDRFEWKLHHCIR